MSDTVGDIWKRSACKDLFVWNHSARVKYKIYLGVVENANFVNSQICCIQTKNIFEIIFRICIFDILQPEAFTIVSISGFG